MRFEVLNFTGIEPNERGAYAEYFKLKNGRGVKVLITQGFENEQTLLTSDAWQRAESELNMLKACTSMITPKGYSLTVVRLSNGLYPGIVMQHVNGKTLGEYAANGTVSRDEYLTVIDRAAKVFQEYTGRMHGDLNSGNIIYNPKSKRIKIIDLDPDFIS